jgi:hypothetical protein
MLPIRLDCDHQCGLPVGRSLPRERAWMTPITAMPELLARPFGRGSSKTDGCCVGISRGLTEATTFFLSPTLVSPTAARREAATAAIRAGQGAVPAPTMS